MHYLQSNKTSFLFSLYHNGLLVRERRIWQKKYFYTNSDNFTEELEF